MSSPRFYIWPRYALEVDGYRIEFTPNTGAVLARLFSAKGHFVSRDDMIDAVYGDDPEGGPLDADGCIKVFICHARKLLSDVGVRVIGWRRTGGYRMIFGDEPIGIDYVEPANGHRGAWRYVTRCEEADSWSVGQFLDSYGSRENTERKPNYGLGDEGGGS